jgi:phosphoglycolate phosphatase
VTTPLRAPADVFSLVALDMNGTTVEDSGIFDLALAHAFAAISEEPPAPEAIAPLRGLAKSEMFHRLTGDAALAEAAYRAFVAAFTTEVDRGAVRPITGVREVLAELRHLGLCVCLMTGFPLALQRSIIQALGWAPLIDLSVSSDEVAHGRPHPDMVEHAAEGAGVDDPARIVVVGDTVNDLLAGQRAGAGLLVGVTTGSHDAAHLRTVQGAWIIDSVASLPDLLALVASAGDQTRSTIDSTAGSNGPGRTTRSGNGGAS